MPGTGPSRFAGAGADDRRLWRVPAWLPIGAAAWAVVAMVYTAAAGLRPLGTGLPFFGAPEQVVGSLGAIFTGAVLSPLLLFLFRRVRSVPRRPAVAVLLYASIGVGYWVVWSLASVGLRQAGVLPMPLPSPAPGGLLLRTLVFHAYVSLVLYAVMVLAFESVHFLRQAEHRRVEAARLHAELSKARTAALCARLDPDFLFGTFRAAADLIDRDVRAARKLLSDLSELLRVSLGRDGDHLIEFGDETRLLRRYLEIRQLRFGGDLQFTLDADVDAAAWRVPPLLLQPLVQAAIQTAANVAQARTTVAIEARCDRDSLRLLVAAGVEPGAPGSDAPAAPEGFETSRSRLDAIYGERATLTAAPTPSGWEVALTIPTPDAAFSPA